MHMSTTTICSVCNAFSDTWRHSFLGCNMARAVWALKEDDLTLPFFSDEASDPKLWLFLLSNTLR
jgi:hypothetical protein